MDLNIDMSVFKAYGHLLLLEKYNQTGIKGIIEKEAYDEMFKLYTHCKSLKPVIEYGPQHDRQTYTFIWPEIFTGDMQKFGQRLTEGAITFWESFYLLKKNFDEYMNHRSNKTAGKEHIDSKPLHFKIKHCDIFIPNGIDASKEYLKNVNAQQNIDEGPGSIPWCTGRQDSKNMTDYYIHKANIKLAYIKYGKSIRDILCLGIKDNGITYDRGATVNYNNRAINNIQEILEISKLTEADINHIIKETSKLVLQQKEQEQDQEDQDFPMIRHKTCLFIWTNGYSKYPSGIYTMMARTNGEDGLSGDDPEFFEIRDFLYDNSKNWNIDNPYIFKSYGDDINFDASWGVLFDADTLAHENVNGYVRKAFGPGIVHAYNESNIKNNIPIQDDDKVEQIIKCYNILISDVFTDFRNSQKLSGTYKEVVNYIKSKIDNQ